MKNVPWIEAARSRARMRGRASATPKRPWDNVTGSLTPRAIQSVSASRSNVRAQAARAPAGQGLTGDAVTGFVMRSFILAQWLTPHQRASIAGLVTAGTSRRECSIEAYAEGRRPHPATRRQYLSRARRKVRGRPAGG